MPYQNEQLQLASAEAKLLREEFRKAAKHAGAPDPGRLVEEYLPMAKFVYGKLIIQLGKEKLTVRKLISRLNKEKHKTPPNAQVLDANEA